MPQDIHTLNLANAAVNQNRTPSTPFSTWATRVSNNLTIVGTGTPEGVLDAAQYTEFVDEAVPLVPVTYRKMLEQVGGDTRKGWAVT